MAWRSRACVFNESLGLWISPRTGKTYTPEQYARLSEIGKRAAAASKALSEAVRDPEYRESTDAMVRRLSENRGPMMPLPGWSERDRLHHVAWSARRGASDLKLTRGGGGNGNS